MLRKDTQRGVNGWKRASFLYPERFGAMIKPQLGRYPTEEEYNYLTQKYKFKE